VLDKSQIAEDQGDETVASLRDAAAQSVEADAHRQSAGAGDLRHLIRAGEAELVRPSQRLAEPEPRAKKVIKLQAYLMGMQQFKIIVEKHPEGFVAYPLGLKGVVVGEGDTYEEALTDVQSAIKFHIETFGDEAAVLDESPVLEAFVAEAGVAV